MALLAEELILRGEQEIQESERLAEQESELGGRGGIRRITSTTTTQRNLRQTQSSVDLDTQSIER